MVMPGLTINASQRPFLGRDSGLCRDKRPATAAFRAGDTLSFGHDEVLKPGELPNKSFWKTVNRDAFGGKRAGFWRKLSGVVVYPYSLAKMAIRWLTGNTQGFKTLHPLRRESQAQMMERIERLNAEIKTPDFRFPFAQQEVAAAGLHKNYLLKAHDSLQGVIQLQSAKDWEATALGLERFLSSNGKNNGHSCGNVSMTHAAKLAYGSPMKRHKLKDAGIVPIGKGSEAPHSVDTVILLPKEYRGWSYDDFGKLPSEKRVKLIQAAEDSLVKRFGLQSAPKLLTDQYSVDQKLLNAGNGAQAMLFDLMGDKGHVTLAVNIKGRVYHIDNRNYQSAQVRQVKDWLDGKAIEKLWYAPLKERVHPGIAGE